MADVNANNYLPSSVKSVQRGQSVLSASGTTTNITISTVDPDKVSLKFWGRGLENVRNPVVTATNIALNSSETFDTFVSWEVLELY